MHRNILVLGTCSIALMGCMGESDKDRPDFAYYNSPIFGRGGELMSVGSANSIVFSVVNRGHKSATCVWEVRRLGLVIAEGEVNGLNPGQTKKIEVYCTEYTAGEVTYRIDLDPDNATDEGEEGELNNTWSLTGYWSADVWG